MLKFFKLGLPYIPIAKARGFTATFDKQTTLDFLNSTFTPSHWQIFAIIVKNCSSSSKWHNLTFVFWSFRISKIVQKGNKFYLAATKSMDKYTQYLEFYCFILYAFEKPKFFLLTSSCTVHSRKFPTSHRYTVYFAFSLRLRKPSNPSSSDLH